MKSCSSVGSLVLVLFLTIGLNCFGQGEFNNWHLGQKTGIAFTASGPQPLLQSAMEAGEGVASVSDASGNLLFYSNGVKVWNRNHQVMPNGAGIMGDVSSSQAALIIPIPNTNRYYLFTVGGMEKGTGDLRYHIINMDLHGGLGDVEWDMKNLLITNNNTEKLVSARATGCGYWLLSHRRYDNAFEARLITEQGIGAPVVSAIGGVHDHPVGMMKMSTDDNQVVVAVAMSFLELFDFNRANGRVTNLLHLPITPGTFPYGVCFSPDNSKLYKAVGHSGNQVKFFQYDLSVPRPQIPQTKMEVGVATIGYPISSADIQLGPDGKLYFSRVATSCIGSIPYPNEKTPACGFVESAICVSGSVGMCLPNSLRIGKGIPAFSLGNDTTVCAGAPLELSVPVKNVQYLWSTGSVQSTITVTTPGKYWVRIERDNCSSSDTIEVFNKIFGTQLPDDTAVCEGMPVMLAPGNFVSFLWQDGSTAPALPVTKAGIYWVKVVNSCGHVASDTVVVVEKKKNFTLSAKHSICYGDSLKLSWTHDIGIKDWQPQYNIKASDKAVNLFPLVDTVYRVKYQWEGGCIAEDSIKVNVKKPLQVTLPADTGMCAGYEVEIDAGGGFTNYAWSNGATARKMRVKQPGLYHVTTSDGNGCLSRDTVMVSLKNCGQQVWVPTAFSPNGDGRNDEFRVSYKGLFEQFRLQIFNRWGQQVFSSSDPDKGWEGRVNGYLSDPGTYLWICEYRLFAGESRLEKGTVVLIR